KIYLDDDLFAKRTKQIAQPKVDFVIEYLNGVKNIDTPKWVDIGSGGGEVLKACTLAGCEAIGVESDPNETEFSRSKGLTVLNEMFNEHNADAILADADIVSVFNVLEHMHDPIGFFRSLTIVEGDRLYVFEVPRHPSISSFLNQCFPNQACRHIYPPDHLHIFTNESIDIMLNECGLESRAIWYFGQDFNEMVTSCASESKFKSKFLPQILSMSNQIQAVIDENELGDAILIIAGRKKSV
ncbi:class I SAM-dependent methyltransferase, partial [Alphaproteobacteria bacterium]|nr:class I SAM-dependent methyltransferase [Alphaproteobacteria bacterium]